MKLGIFLLIALSGFFAHAKQSFCMQNFNAYGPVYAPSVVSRTARMNYEVLQMPQCDVVQLQEVWNKGQIDQVTEDLSSSYHISAPNRAQKIGVMSLFQGLIQKTETHLFKVNSDGGFLDGARETFNVKKAFHVVKADLPRLSESMYFMNAHLHPTSQAVRLTQILDLLDWRLQNQDL